MSAKDERYEIGYESLLSHFKEVQKQSPKGVSLKRNRQTVNLQFEINGERNPHGCNSTFSYDGIAKALAKARLVADKLKKIDSETEFWEWYDKEIKEENKIKADLLTFGEAIKLVENDFWRRPRRNKEGQKRDRSNASDNRSLYETYTKFYVSLPLAKNMNWQDVDRAIDKSKQGKKIHKLCVSAFRKMARLSGNDAILAKLDKIDITQTEFREIQVVDTQQFLEWRNRVLGITASLHFNAQKHMDSRKAWLWVLSTQLVYGMRISEVFAILNLTEPYTTKDGVVFKALNDPENRDNLIILSEKTQIGTTIKTGERIARPLIPVEHYQLIELLEIKNVVLPANKPREGSDFKTIATFYARSARNKLIDWNAPFTQTHASRRLGNLNGMLGGIPQEIRSQSLGHTPRSNDESYKKHQHTKTTIDLLLNHQKQAIDFVSALNAAKEIIKLHPDSRNGLIALLARIYQKDSIEIGKLFE